MDLIKVILNNYDSLKIGDQVTASDGGTYQVISIVKVEQEYEKTIVWATGIGLWKYGEINNSNL